MRSSLFQKTVLVFTFAFFLGIGAGYIIFADAFDRLPSPPIPLKGMWFETEESESLNIETNIKNLDLSPLSEIWDLMRAKFVEPEKLSLEKLGEFAMKGFVAGLGDPYTVYMTKEESKEFQENLNGSLEGIGAELEIRNGVLVIVTPLKNSPAAAAGIKAGDFIEKIDGDPAAEMTLHEAVRRIRGKSGTKVTLTLIREDREKSFDITITRGPIEIESITTKDVGKNLTLISLNQFGDNTKNEFQEAIQQLLLKKPKGLILDLRFNGGGYLDISVDILSEFLAGKITAVKIKQRDPLKNEILETDGQARIHDIPLVVLVNRGSASASEIVAGALQDHKRAVIMGKRTFGKGSVQEIEPLRDGSTLRLTIAKWLTPLDRDIDEIGIEPDIEVEFPDDTPEGKDPQLEEAIRYLEEPS